MQPITRRRFLISTSGLLLGGGLVGLEYSVRPRTARGQAIPGAPSFRGAAGTSVVGPVPLNAGVTVLRAQHNGSGNFTVELFVPAPGETPQQSATLADYSDAFLVFDLIGAVKPAAGVVATMPGDHFLQVRAAGAWQITVEQPLPETVSPMLQSRFSGRGTDVSPYFMLAPNVSTISVSTSSAALRAWLYHVDDLGGEAIEAGLDIYDSRIFDFTFPGNQTSYPVQLPVPVDNAGIPQNSGPYILAVNNVGNQDQWTITFT